MSLILTLFPFLIAAEKVGVFDENYSDIENSNQTIVNSYITDKDLLEEAIKQYGIKIMDNENELKALVEKGNIIFSQNDSGTYDLIFTGEFTNEDCENITSAIYDEYTLIVQQQVYENLINNIEKKDYTIESEVTTDDDSIVITLQI